MNIKMKVKVRPWLRLFRAQTAPATVLIMLVPYLAGASFLSWSTLALAVYGLLLHWWTFGDNSLMDAAMGYDKKDPSKAHHPLLTEDWDESISLHDAHNVIHWGLAVLLTIGGVGSIAWAASPALATLCLLVYVAFGYSYNCGLSKESIQGWLPISVCFASLAGFGWFLSHQGAGWMGWAFLCYVFVTEVFEISYEGNLKELPVAGRVERDNLLRRMGAKVTLETEIVEQHSMYGTRYNHLWFEPGPARAFAWAVKMAGLALAAGLAVRRWDLAVWWLGMGVATICLLEVLTGSREFVRAKELRAMSAMEVVSIYLPIPCLVAWPVAAALMALGVAYFFGMNKAIWGTDYPRV